MERTSKLTTGSKRKFSEAVVWLWIGEVQTLSSFDVDRRSLLSTTSGENPRNRGYKAAQIGGQRGPQSLPLRRERAEEVAKHQGNRQLDILRVRAVERGFRRERCKKKMTIPFLRRARSSDGEQLWRRVGHGRMRGGLVNKKSERY